MKHAIEDAPPLANVGRLKTGAQGIVPTLLATCSQIPSSVVGPAGSLQSAESLRLRYLSSSYCTSDKDVSESTVVASAIEHGHRLFPQHFLTVSISLDSGASTVSTE